MPTSKSQKQVLQYYSPSKLQWKPASYSYEETRPLIKLHCKVWSTRLDNLAGKLHSMRVISHCQVVAKFIIPE